MDSKITKKSDGVFYPFIGSLKSKGPATHRARVFDQNGSAIRWITVCGVSFTDESDWSGAGGRWVVHTPDVTDLMGHSDAHEAGTPTCVECAFQLGVTTINATSAGTGRIPKNQDRRVASYGVVTAVPEGKDVRGNLALKLDLYLDSGVGETPQRLVDAMGVDMMMTMRAPVFNVGEILLLDGSGREIGYPGRKPGKWDVTVESFGSLTEALDCLEKVRLP